MVQPCSDEHYEILHSCIDDDRDEMEKNRSMSDLAYEEQEQLWPRPGFYQL